MTVLCASLKQQYHHRMVTENTILLVFLTLLLKELNTMQQTAFFFLQLLDILLQTAAIISTLQLASAIYAEFVFNITHNFFHVH